MASNTAQTMRVKESATIRQACVTIRMQPAGLVLNTETKMPTKKLTDKASGPATMKVINVTEVALAVELRVVPQTF